MIRLITIFILSLSFSQKGIASPYGQLEQEFKSRFDDNSQIDGPGYVVNISESGSVMLNIELGKSNLEHGIAINGDTVFHVASLSKQITAATLAHAIKDGLINLGDPVSKWMPQTRKYGKELKIEHLLYMTSGLTEYTEINRAGKQPWATFHYFSNEEAIEASLSVDKLQFDPGTKWQYSNVNFMIIAEIVSIAYAKSFSDVARDKIFKPLNMHSSLINDDITQIIPNKADAYLDRTDGVLSELTKGARIDAKSNNGLVKIHRNSPHYGGSGVMTSMNDWTLWQKELADKKVFGKEFWSLMLSTKKFQHAKANDAFGLVHGNRCGEATLWYEGGDIDASSYSITFPSSALNFSCFSNDPLSNCRAKIDWLISRSDMCLSN